MKNNTIITMIKKELDRFFKDSRMVVNTILLPGLMIYVLYTLMGIALANQLEPDVYDYYETKAIHIPAEWKDDLWYMEEIPDEEEAIDKVMEDIRDQKCALFVVFPENLLESATEYHASLLKNPKISYVEESSESEIYIHEEERLAPQIYIYYNSAYTDSQKAYQDMVEYLDDYESSRANLFDINNDARVKFDLATEEDTTGKLFSSTVPFLLIIFLYSGCIAVAPESIAGEKERGTMASLLITPAKRSHIALGKIAALSVIAVLSGASSALGTLLSMPNLMDTDSSGINQSVYTFTDYALLAVVILSTALVLITMISLISAFAKDLKEAQTYVTPLMVIVMLVGITAMFGDGAKSFLGYYCIPLYNSVQSMVGIFSFKATTMQLLVTVIANIVATGAGAFVLSKMFDSEYIMFHK